MALSHAQPGEVVDVRPFGHQLTDARTTTLIKTGRMEVVRIVMKAGKQISEHEAPGEIIVQCLEGDITFTTMGEAKKLRTGDMLYLAANEPHALEAIEDSSVLLTIVRTPKDGH